MSTTTVTIKEVCRLVCEFAMKTSVTAPTHLNGHTYMDDKHGPVAVAAFWNVDIAQAKVNVAFLKTGNSYTYWMNREKIQDHWGNDIDPTSINGSVLVSLTDIVQKCMDDQNEILRVNSPREAIPID